MKYVGNISMGEIEKNIFFWYLKKYDFKVNYDIVFWDL